MSRLHTDDRGSCESISSKLTQAPAAGRVYWPGNTSRSETGRPPPLPSHTFMFSNKSIGMDSPMGSGIRNSSCFHKWGVLIAAFLQEEQTRHNTRGASRLQRDRVRCFVIRGGRQSVNIAPRISRGSCRTGAPICPQIFILLISVVFLSRRSARMRFSHGCSISSSTASCCSIEARFLVHSLMYDAILSRSTSERP